MRHKVRIYNGGGDDGFREVEVGSPDNAFVEALEWLHFGPRAEVSNALPWLDVAARLCETDEDFRELERYSADVDKLVPKDVWRRYMSGRLKIPLKSLQRSKRGER